MRVKPITIRVRVMYGSGLFALWLNREKREVVAINPEEGQLLSDFMDQCGVDLAGAFTAELKGRPGMEADIMIYGPCDPQLVEIL